MGRRKWGEKVGRERGRGGEGWGEKERLRPYLTSHPSSPGLPNVSIEDVDVLLIAYVISNHGLVKPLVVMEEVGHLLWIRRRGKETLLDHVLHCRTGLLVEQLCGYLHDLGRRKWAESKVM